MNTQLDAAAEALQSSSKAAISSLANPDQTLKELIQLLAQLPEILSARAIPSSDLAVNFRDWENRFHAWELKHQSLMNQLRTGNNNATWTQFDSDCTTVSNLIGQHT